MDNTTNVALSRLVSQSRAMDVIAGNIANVSTPGYRAERTVFADWLLAQTGTRHAPGAERIAFTQDRATWRERAEGTLTHTGNPLDLALSGDGFFSVQTQQGVRLTRAGRFALQKDGGITDEAGHALLDTSGQPLRLSPADTTLTVSADGALSSQNGPIGRIGIVSMSDPNRLQAEGGRLFRADAATTPVASPKIVQGAVEDSNVQPVSEIVRMIATQRDFQFMTQFVEAEGQRRQTAIERIAAPVNA